MAETEPVEEAPETRRWWILDPNSRGKQTFDVIVAAVLIYNVLVVPFRVSFNVEADGFFFALETIMDIIFILDLCLNFITAAYIRGETVWEPLGIAKHYLKGWFWVDFVSAFPLDLMLLAAISVTSNQRNLLRLPKVVRLLRLARLLRLVRLFKLTRLYRTWKAHVNINSSIYRLANLAVLTLLISHFLACFWFLVASMEPEGVKTWITVAGLHNAKTWEQYVTAQYWAVATITTVGYGDVVAHSQAERVFILVGMIIGVSFFAYAVGSMTYLVQRMDEDPTRDRMDQVNSYMRYRGFPEDLQVAIREHYLFSWTRRQAAWEENQIMKELSSSLRTRVAMFLKDRVLRNNPLFSGASEAFITELILHFKPETAAPGDYIVHMGSIGREMYLLSEGTVEVVVDEDNVVAQLNRGSYFGEIALMTPDALRMASVRAVTHCHLDVLMKTSFEAVLEKFPDEVENLGIVKTATARLDALDDAEETKSRHTETKRRLSRPESFSLRRPSIMLAGDSDSAEEEDAPKEERRRLIVSLAGQETSAMCTIGAHTTIAGLRTAVGAALEVGDVGELRLVAGTLQARIWRDIDVQQLEKGDHIVSSSSTSPSLPPPPPLPLPPRPTHLTPIQVDEFPF